MLNIELTALTFPIVFIVAHVTELVSLMDRPFSAASENLRAAVL